MSASRKWLAVPSPSTGRPTPCGTLCPPPTSPRASPVVGRNQCSLMLMRCSSGVRDGRVEAVGEEVGDVEPAGQQLVGAERVGHLLLGGRHLGADLGGLGDATDE